MPAAFDVSELVDLAEHFAEAADLADERGREFMRTALDDTADRMRREVPKDSRETHNHITVEVDDGGLGGTVGPTNVDDKGRPIGFFIEYGTSDTAPDPFVKRTSDWAARTLPDRAEKLVRDIL